MDDGEGTASAVPPLSNRGLAQTLHMWVVLRAEAVVLSVVINRMSAVVLDVGVKSSFGETCCLLVVINTTMVARPYDWREWDRGSLAVGRTSARNASSSR